MVLLADQTCLLEEEIPLVRGKIDEVIQRSVAEIEVQGRDIVALQDAC